MSETIIDYLEKYKDYPLSRMPFNDVDSLILCQLSYLKFDGMVCDVRRSGACVTLSALKEHADYEKLFADKRYETVNRALFQAAVTGRRFGDMKLNCYINLVEKERELQFAAITYILEDGTMYVAFRGTDETLVGWKEDFNMSYLSSTPGQDYSVKYLNMVAGRLNNKFIVGGHSKGGNFAVYSAMRCLPSIQERICKIYNMDGPGFRPEILISCGYKQIADRVVKILPQSSIIGMIFENGMEYQVVESKSFGLAQHDPFNWLIADKEFKKVTELYESRRIMNEVVNEWILSMNEEQLRSFIDTLYQVISASRAENLIEFAADWKTNLKRILAAFRELDEQTAAMMKQISKSFFEIKHTHRQSRRLKEKELLSQTPL
ncbi:MAG: DUF2974 domain-containing protein [Lachnospiraceae bacterium]|nr:DUF2974 domain-containing protein [Lachnospiraceae bacterium]